jgi:hypothetical protein
MSACRQEIIFGRPDLTVANLSIETCKAVAAKMEGMVSEIPDSEKFTKALSELRAERHGRASRPNSEVCVLKAPDHGDTNTFVRDVIDTVNEWLNSLGIADVLGRRGKRTRHAKRKRGRA